jgi:hypothetical protein
MANARNRMNRKGGIAEVLQDNLSYLIILVVFVILMFVFVNHQKQGSAIWGEMYLSKIVSTIDYARPGDSYVIDVHRATEVAKANGIVDLGQVVSIDADRKRVCVKLSPDGIDCMNYFNDVAITGFKVSIEPPVNTISFNVTATGGANG